MIVLIDGELEAIVLFLQVNKKPPAAADPAKIKQLEAEVCLNNVK